MDNQAQKTIEEQVSELTEKQKDTIIKVGKVALILQLVVAIPILLICIIGLFAMKNPPLGFDYNEIFSGIMSLLVIMAIWVVGILAFVKIKWPYYSDKKWQYINKIRKQKYN